VARLNVCIEGGGFWPIKPVSYFCPVSCGCHSGDPHCPDKCPARTPATPRCPAAHRDVYANPFGGGTCPMSGLVNL
jgi:hypothetical protein